MNNPSEAKRGFITFISTLVIASSVFFATYFMVNNLNMKAQVASEDKKEVTKKGGEASAMATQEKPNVFANLVERTPADPVKETDTKPSVLGGATNQATSGAVPSTGSNSLTALVLMGSSLILFGTYFGAKKARTLAIRTFEKKISE